MKFILVSLFLSGCVTMPPQGTHLYRCYDENPMADGACELIAVFSSKINCIKRLPKLKNTDEYYYMCSLGEDIK